MLENNEIIVFLENIINDIKSNNISQDHMQQVTELFLNLKMENKIEDTVESYSDKEFIKFLSLGWYVYTEYLKKNNI